MPQSPRSTSGPLVQTREDGRTVDAKSIQHISCRVAVEEQPTTRCPSASVSSRCNGLIAVEGVFTKISPLYHRRWGGLPRALDARRPSPPARSHTPRTKGMSKRDNQIGSPPEWIPPPTPASLIWSHSAQVFLELVVKVEAMPTHEVLLDRAVSVAPDQNVQASCADKPRQPHSRTHYRRSDRSVAFHPYCVNLRLELSAHKSPWDLVHPNDDIADKRCCGHSV
jgi:hypothetical protein